MIPKTIHYCWFGRNPKPALAQKCLQSWKKHCPDYTIMEWNEDNYDISSAPLYVRQAYGAKKWAFVTDYVRLHVVHDHGGIYMDTDVELKKNPDALLEHSAYFGFEDGQYVNTGLGFGAVPGHPILKEIMYDYIGIPFRSGRRQHQHGNLPHPQHKSSSSPRPAAGRFPAGTGRRCVDSAFHLPVPPVLPDRKAQILPQNSFHPLV